MSRRWRIAIVSLGVAFVAFSLMFWVFEIGSEEDAPHPLGATAALRSF